MDRTENKNHEGCNYSILSQTDSLLASATIGIQSVFLRKGNPKLLDTWRRKLLDTPEG